MLKLYSYWRSSASYRVRIALNLKGLEYELIPVHLMREEQRGESFRALNPQQRVPLLVDGEVKLAQSLAIIDWLDARHGGTPLIPQDARARADVLSFAQAIIADIQPLQNTGTLNYLRDALNVDEAGRTAWLQYFIDRMLANLEVEAAARPATPFVFGETPTLADCALVPQLFAAQRFGLEPSRYPRLAAIAAHCNTLPAFQRAHPAQQPDAER